MKIILSLRAMQKQASSHSLPHFKTNCLEEETLKKALRIPHEDKISISVRGRKEFLELKIPAAELKTSGAELGDKVKDIAQEVE